MADAPPVSSVLNFKLTNEIEICHAHLQSIIDRNSDFPQSMADG